MEENHNLACRIYKSYQSKRPKECPFCGLQNISSIDVYLHVKNCLQIYEKITSTSPQDVSSTSSLEPNTDLSSSSSDYSEENRYHKQQWMEQKRIEFKRKNPNEIEPIGNWEMEYSIMFE